MRAHFQLPSVQSVDQEAKPPIQVKFEIPYFTTSGIQVKEIFILEFFIFFH
jgi:AP-1 complex subunit mu